MTLSYLVQGELLKTHARHGVSKHGDRVYGTVMQIEEELHDCGWIATLVDLLADFQSGTRSWL